VVEHRSLLFSIEVAGSAKIGVVERRDLGRDAPGGSLVETGAEDGSKAFAGDGLEGESLLAGHREPLRAIFSFEAQYPER